MQAWPGGRPPSHWMGRPGRGQLCRVAQVRRTDLLKGSQGLPTFEKEPSKANTQGVGWGVGGEEPPGAAVLAPSSLPPVPWPHSCHSPPPRLRGMCLFYTEPRKRHKPLAAFLSALLGSAGIFTKDFHKY